MAPPHEEPYFTTFGSLFFFLILLVFLLLLFKSDIIDLLSIKLLFKKILFTASVIPNTSQSLGPFTLTVTDLQGVSVSFRRYFTICITRNDLINLKPQHKASLHIISHLPFHLILHHYPKPYIISI